MNRALQAAPCTARQRFDEAAGLLVGSCCTNCGTRSWPSRVICARCGSDRLDQSTLPAVGTLQTCTSVWVSRPGLPVPYMLGQIDLGAGAVVFGHLRGLAADASLPTAVRIRLSADATSIPRFWFEPETSSRAATGRGE
jgi:uncharacterized protein